MSHTFSTDVLICGAGAAGLTLAIDLARRGIALRLIDKIDGPFLGARGKAIQPRSQEVFEDLGIVDRVVAAGGRIHLSECIGMMEAIEIADHAASRSDAR